MSTTAARINFEPTRFVLPNGVTVLTQDNPSSPAVTVSIRLAAGAAFESRQTMGLAGFTAAMLKRGTAKRSKAEIGELLDFTGALLSAGASRHTAGVGTKSRAADFTHMIELLAECVITPAFPVAETEKLRGDILTAIYEDADDTRQISTDLLRASIYPEEHPYAWRLLGTEETIRHIGRDDLAAFHETHFGPGGAVVVVVGAVDAESVTEAVTGAFAEWTAATGVQGPDGGGLPAALPNIADVEPPPGIERHTKTMEDKAQADVALGHPGMRRHDDDYYPAAVMNMILGRFAMGGRLGRSIREEKGMAYYAYSTLGASVGPSPFVVRAGVDAANVDAAVDCILEEMTTMQTEPVGEEELDDARSAIIRSLPRTFETNEGMAGALHAMEQYRLGLDYFSRFPDLIGEVSVEQIQNVASRRLHPDRCSVVVAGPYPVGDAD